MQRDVTKANARALRKVEAQFRRKQRRIELRCFFTPPFRHEFAEMFNAGDEGAYEGMNTAEVCVGCGRRALG